MQGYLTVTNRALAYHDVPATANPNLKAFDWAMSIKNLTVSDPKTIAGSLSAGASVTVFDGTRSTSLDGTSAFATTLSTLDAGTRYRFTWTGGTNPILRTTRALTLSGSNATVAVNADSTINLSIDVGTFGATAAGDIVFIPGLVTGDAVTVFNEANAGFWTVLAVVSATNLQLARPTGDSFSATGEVVLLASNAQLQAFTSDGVQVGDNVKVSAGFASTSRRTYTVDRVTATWFEVLSTSAIAIETGKLPGAAGLVFYTDGKRFVRLQADQSCIARFNGDTGDTNELAPVQAGDSTQPCWDERFGPSFKLVLVNRSTATLNFICLTAR